MLYLGGGMREVKLSDHDTLQVFSDFGDPGQFYYLPNFPHIAKMEDGTPAIRLLVYRQNLDEIADTDPEAVAFLSLDVDLSWDPALIDHAANKLQLDDRLPDKPRLTPIFFNKGSVKLLLLDAATPDDDAGRPADARPSEFVTKIMGGASPSLYGDNRAIFQASLSKKGAAALSAALDGVTPIGVVYSLTFAGLQPAFHIKANVDWQKVYDHFSEREHANFIFYESDIQKSIDKLVEKKVITIEETVEGIGAEAMDAEREAVMTSVRQLIFEKFFEATFKPVDPAGGGTANDVVDTLTHLARNGLTLGMGYSYSRKEVKIEELRTLDIDWTARKATERVIYPQAHMYNLMARSGVTKDKLVTVVDGSAEIWRVLPFQIIAAAAWDDDAIAGITVDVEYKDPDALSPRGLSVFLDKEHSKITKRDWMDRVGGSNFRYKYEVVFKDNGVPGPHQKVTSGKTWLEQSGTVLVINPRDLYEAVDLEVAATTDFPFNRWPAVQAVIRYRADDGSFEHYEDGVLRQDNKKLAAKFRIDKGVPGRREVQLTFIGATGERVDQPWMPMPQDQYIVVDPRPKKLTVRAVVSGDRANIANLLVDLEYSDDENGIFENQQFAFDPDNMTKPATWIVNLADPAKQRYRYRMTLVTKNGDFLQTGWISTDSPTLAVGEMYVRLLTVDIVTGAFEPGVDAVEVAVVYDDNNGNVHDAKTFRLGPKSRSQWEVKLQDASNRSYKMTTTWIRPDGFNPKVGPLTTSDTYVVVPGKPPR
jgi:hypothetical protein